MNTLSKLRKLFLESYVPVNVVLNYQCGLISLGDNVLYGIEMASPTPYVAQSVESTCSRRQRFHVNILSDHAIHVLKIYTAEYRT